LWAEGGFLFSSIPLIFRGGSGRFVLYKLQKLVKGLAKLVGWGWFPVLRIRERGFLGGKDERERMIGKHLMDASRLSVILMSGQSMIFPSLFSFETAGFTLYSLIITLPVLLLLPLSFPSSPAGVEQQGVGWLHLWLLLDHGFFCFHLKASFCFLCCQSQLLVEIHNDGPGLKTQVVCS